MNRKAEDQFKQFTDQRKAWASSKKNEESIIDLMKGSEEKNKEFIQNNFEKISTSFSSLLSRLSNMRGQLNLYGEGSPMEIEILVDDKNVSPLGGGQKHVFHLPFYFHFMKLSHHPFIYLMKLMLIWMLITEKMLQIHLFHF